ncbi:MAG: putative MaoC-like dehydratase [bacterium]|nr:putative MaoC-like dehydratase [bacterium]
MTQPVAVMGRSARWRRRVTQADFDRFARVSGDDNPIHVDAAFAARTRFGRTLAHGMMLYSLVVHLIRSELLPGSVELEQDLVFPGPVFAGDELVIDAEVVRIDFVLGHVEVRTRVHRFGDGDGDGGLGCEGRTLVSADV